jgi:phosphoglycolate phosphatase
MDQSKRKAAVTYPAAVVWDLDGTLVDSATDLATALNTLLAEKDQQTHAVDKVRPMIGHGVAKLIERGFRQAGVSLSETERGSMVPRFMEIYSACATDTTYLMPQARELLEHFFQAGVRQGVCTNKPVSVTRQILAALEVGDYFGSVVGGDSTSRRKPDPLPLQTCLEELGVTARDAVMIGDSGADVGASRAAGVKIILVPDGYTGVPASTLGADIVVGNLAEVPSSLPTHPFQNQYA